MISISFTQSRKGQTQIKNFIEKTIRPIGNRSDWKILVDACNEEALAFDSSRLLSLIETFSKYRELLPPGHDVGHMLRDTLNALLVSQVERISPSERLAGILGGIFHDIGNSVAPRYMDRINNASHASIGAWLFYRLSKNHLSQGLRTLVAYSIAAHTHLLQPVSTSFPKEHVAMPFWDEIWVEGNVLYGVAIRITRWSDRLDTNGLTLVVRNLISKCDLGEEGGSDYSGDQWIALNEQSYQATFLPHNTSPFPGTVTTLQHALNFKASNFKLGSPYSKDDYINVHLIRLLYYKLDQLDEILTVVGDHVCCRDCQSSVCLDLEGIKKVVTTISRGKNNPRFNQAWSVFEKRFGQLSQEDQNRWGRLFFEISFRYRLLLVYYERHLPQHYQEIALWALAELKK